MKIYTTEEVAEMLQLNQLTVQRYLAKGVIKGFKIGASWRIEEQELLNYIERLKNITKGVANE